MSNIQKIFASMVFNDGVMRERLPKETYKALKKAIATGRQLELEVANVVASAMKDWACEKGATHFTHWFQPMTGITAEKHDSFISPDGDGKVIMEFSGKELVRGEPDASSFPSGGLRATFEARGYTAWDPSSYAFIKDNTLCIPTAFCSYSGEALDKKTPLLRSMDAIDRQAVRVLNLIGDTDVYRVTTTVGAEQEYFLIDKKVFEKRQDLLYCGRTLFGARPPKGQEMDDHYFGSLKPRVAAYMRDLDEELWKLGVTAKTEHNEVAPAQHELAPVYTTTNIATDHNQLTMELMKSIAAKHGLACLLHEKPFAGINGSGKHNNWSIFTNTGINLLDPGKTPSQNTRFLLFLSAVIHAVDEHQDLLRISVASAGNDHRLGANEAPPAIVSIFLGDELTDILEAMETESAYTERIKTKMEISAKVLPHIPKDTTDRNRTSPFAFTGNKFEFRMPGSSFSISGPNVVLNTIVADVLEQFAEKLEQAEDKTKTVYDIVRETIVNHKRIIFNGNNYCEEWVQEAEARGLLNLKSTVDALPKFTSQKNIDLFQKHGVLSATEIHSRYDILLENYIKTLHIEALTMIDMVKKDVMSSLVSYQNELVTLAAGKKSLGMEYTLEDRLITQASRLGECLFAKLVVLEDVAIKAKDQPGILEQAAFYRNEVVVSMLSLRSVVDELESTIFKRHWTLPTYADMLYSVK